jgi:hypothetical protein
MIEQKFNAYYYFNYFYFGWRTSAGEGFV